MGWMGWQPIVAHRLFLFYSSYTGLEGRILCFGGTRTHTSGRHLWLQTHAACPGQGTHRASCVPRAGGAGMHLEVPPPGAGARETQDAPSSLGQCRAGTIGVPGVGGAGGWSAGRRLGRGTLGVGVLEGDMLNWQQAVAGPQCPSSATNPGSPPGSPPAGPPAGVCSSLGSTLRFAPHPHPVARERHPIRPHRPFRPRRAI